MNLKPDKPNPTAFNTTNTGELPNVDANVDVNLGIGAGEEEESITNF